MSAPGRRRGLRRRLTEVLVAAALLPVTAISVTAALVILGGLEEDIALEAGRAVDVARGRLLARVQELAAQAEGLGSDRELRLALGSDRAAILARLGATTDGRAAFMVEVADAGGRVLARCVRPSCGGGAIPPRYRGLETADGAGSIKRALGYERTVTIEAAGPGLVARAAVPLVDPALRLVGVVVVSLPIDGVMADAIKSDLGASREVMFYRGVEPLASTVVAVTGTRLPGPPLETPVDDEARSARGSEMVLDGRAYTVAVGRLQDMDGRPVGHLGLAIDRAPLTLARRRALYTLVLGGASTVVLALLLAALVARRLARPLQDLNAGVKAIARGDLDTRIRVGADDEIGDLAEAFRAMTRSLKENQEGLAARVRELVTVHQVGRAVSSVVELPDVLARVVQEVVGVLRVRTAAIALSEAADPTSSSIGFEVRASAGEPPPPGLARVAAAVAAAGRPRRSDAVESDPELGALARAAGVSGPLVAAPLSLKDRVVGVIVGVRQGAAPFQEADLRLLATLADQTATAIENARLYAEVRAFSENLERKVRERTLELVQANAEIERTLLELGQTQGQLIHSERMAGLGVLAAGIAHEVNSPAAAVQGSIDALDATVHRLGLHARTIVGLGLAPDRLDRFFDLVDEALPRLAAAPMEPPTTARRRLRDLRARFEGQPGGVEAATALAELGAPGEELAPALLELAPEQGPGALAGYLQELTFLARGAATIRTAVGTIRRIVGALKSYSRLDEAPLEKVDLHAGLEDTLVILHHKLKYGIHTVRKYGELPLIAAYVGELNQVWTNLIHNAVQALEGAGSGAGDGDPDKPNGEIVIETSAKDGMVTVSVVDSGPGIPADVLPLIFKPFYTTKGKGEGTGLGLAIVARIVEKHGGSIRVDSRPGRTRFEVTLPVDGGASTRTRRVTAPPVESGSHAAGAGHPGAGEAPSRHVASPGEATSAGPAEAGSAAAGPAEAGSAAAGPAEAGSAAAGPAEAGSAAAGPAEAGSAAAGSAEAGSAAAGPAEAGSAAAGPAEAGSAAVVVAGADSAAPGGKVDA